MTIVSLGFVEVRGASNAIAVADAMVKASNVRILSESRLDPGQVTVVVEGDLGACHAAIEAGAEVARKHDCLVSTLLKGKPDIAIERLFEKAVATPGAPMGAPPAAASGSASGGAGPAADIAPQPGASAQEGSDEAPAEPADGVPAEPSDGTPAEHTDSAATDTDAPAQRPRRLAHDEDTNDEAPAATVPAATGDEDGAGSPDPLDAVVEFIGAGQNGRTMAEIAGMFGVSAATARSWVRELVEQGRIERFNRGVRLPS